MEKKYIRINRETYDELAKEYKNRNYAVQDDFYINTMFAGLEFANGKKILEIGPGRGDRLKNFCDYGLDVTAIELSKEMSIICKERAPKAKIINKNVFECEFEDKFDFIYMEAMIHNFPLEDAKKLLDLVYTWLSDDGILICTTTVEKDDYEGYEEKSDYQNKKKRFRHRFTEKTFDNLFTEQNFKIIDKKYKEEKDELRTKLWQIVYAKKQIK
jgi:cyclopropane fatty-acyl-phospholipid synthase-like methyltransferase